MAASGRAERPKWVRTQRRQERDLTEPRYPLSGAAGQFRVSAADSSETVSSCQQSSAAVSRLHTVGGQRLSAALSSSD